MAGDQSDTLDKKIYDNITYKAKPSIVSISKKYDIPEHGDEDVDFDEIRRMLLRSHEFSDDDIAQFKKSNDIRYFLADLDTGEFSKERVQGIIERYKNNPDFRKEFKSLLEK
ncbi:MAG: hypothetical protein ACOCZV_01560 [Nanoarchaeota archaeon]